eukprot:3931992-Amphidinium_carterae.1
MPVFDGKIDFAQMNRDFDKKLADRNASSPDIPSPCRPNQPGLGMPMETEMASSQVFVDVSMDHSREIGMALLPVQDRSPRTSLAPTDAEMESVPAFAEVTHDFARGSDPPAPPRPSELSKGVQQLRVQ